MPRFFNTAGPCDPAKHYTLPIEPRLPEVRELIEKEQYFILHAPRQSGKTTCFRELARTLIAEGRVVAVHVSCESGATTRSDVEGGVQTVLEALALQAEVLPEDLQPPALDEFGELRAERRLRTLLTRWSERSRLPVVLFLDEIDALLDETLISVLRQLRDGYPDRPDRFPSSIVLIGMRDVRDYKARLRPDSQTLGTASPFNIKSESLTLGNFTAEEVAALYGQHTEETGQLFTDVALGRAWELTHGQPWLVSALARQLVEKIVPDRMTTIEGEHVDRAAEILIARRDTHLDSLIERLREERVRRVIAPILAGELLVGDRFDDDIAYVEDLGLVDSSGGHLQIANPIYHEVIPRALAASTQKTIPHETAWYVKPDGRLDMEGLLAGFLEFWREHGEAMLRSQPYPEVAFQLVVMSFLQRITNGDGSIHREYAIGRGRMDLCIEWPWQGGVQREVLELKVWRDGKPDPLARGLEQLGSYLDSLGLDHGALLLFDRRESARPLAERSESSVVEHGGRTVRLLRL
ncbi:MAG: ATP-binding protein [Thermoanaerobaculia bacterium]|nr:ATP-binding protein [Thermoanaerobaculia bacterium]